MANVSANEAPQNRVPENQTVETDVPARLDRLPWSRWHTRIIIALGTSWLLDGLEVTLVGSLSGVLESKNGLSLTDPQVTSAATFYLAGAVMGAILFGYLTDRLGRKKLFLVTLATYSLATIASAFSWNFLSFAIFRFFTGCGIGGEYSAINSAVDELIPGKVRGTVDLVVNGTFWVGATIGALAAMFLLTAMVSLRLPAGAMHSGSAAVWVLRYWSCGSTSRRAHAG
jgi:MFS family permease